MSDKTALEVLSNSPDRWDFINPNEFHPKLYVEFASDGEWVAFHETIDGLARALVAAGLPELDGRSWSEFPE